MRARLRARNRRPEWLQTQRYVAKERERASAHSSQKKRGARSAIEFLPIYLTIAT